MPPTTIRRTLLQRQCPLLPSSKSSRAAKNQQIRHESSYRRQVQRLSIPPAPSFTQQSSTPQSTHVVFNPPSSAPNVYHTPLKFLPPGDKRRALYETSVSMYNLPSSISSRSTPSASPITKPGTALHETPLSFPATLAPRLPPSAPRPPPLKPPQAKKYHLGPAEIAEMRRLRDEDHRKWTQQALADKFQCSQFFVRIVAKNEEAGREHGRRIEEAKRKWGRGRRLARMERGRRKELWGRDA